MVKNGVAINLRTINTGSKTSEITQIAAIWQENLDFKSIHFHIKNPYKRSSGAVSLEEAITVLHKIIAHRPVILFNNQGKEAMILKQAFHKFKLAFNSKIYDVSEGALAEGIVKNNLTNLTKIYDVFRKNSKDLPTSLYKAREVYLVAWKMFGTDE